jgi:ribosomal protein L7Ae-like RNA K-turn-binding protein
VDLREKLPGRGAWVHARGECLGKVAARPGALRLGPKLSSANVEDLVRVAVAGAALDGLSLAQAAGALVSGFDKLSSALRGGAIHSVALANDASARTVEQLRDAATERVRFACVPLSAVALGARIGQGPRAAVGVTTSRAGTHLRRQLRRLHDLG